MVKLTTLPEVVEQINEVLPIEEPKMSDRVISIDRISRTVKGGRRIRFRAIVVVGNHAAQVGVGVAKANDVQTAIAKAKNNANKTIITVPMKGKTIPHEITQELDSTRVILKPAPEGHSIIAGGAVRAVVELAGITNIVSKSIGSNNALNNAMATYMALKKLDKDIQPRKKD